MSLGRAFTQEVFSEAALCASLLVVRAPGGVGTFRVMTSTPPVPFAGITKQNVNPQHLLDANLGFVQPARP